MKGSRSILSALGILVGVIIGAGMFALPYVVSKAGILWGVFHLVVAFCILTTIHLLYGEIAFTTRGRHRLPGYARIYLGEVAEEVALISGIVQFYGALLVYGILGGLFLQGMLGTWALSSEALTIIFFIAGGLILLGSMRNVGMVNFFLTMGLVACVVFLVVMSLPDIQISNYAIGDGMYWFLPYGVFLFALGGASAVPDVADVLRKQSRRTFRRIIVLGTFIPLLIYAVFIAAVIGVSGSNTSKEAILGLQPFLGKGVVSIGSFLGFLAVFTSFIVMGLDLRNLFQYDYGWKKGGALFAVLAVPVFLFLFGVSNFIALIGLMGAVSIAIDGILILLIALQLHGVKKYMPHILPFRKMLPWMLILALGSGVLYEVSSYLKL